MEEYLKQRAVEMFLSEAPTENAWDLLMNAQEELPEGFELWEPFEHWDICGIKSLARDNYAALVDTVRTVKDLERL